MVWRVTWRIVAAFVKVKRSWVVIVILFTWKTIHYLLHNVKGEGKAVLKVLAPGEGEASRPQPFPARLAIVKTREKNKKVGCFPTSLR